MKAIDVYKEMNLIEALRAIGQGYKVRGDDWGLDSYIRFNDIYTKIIDEDDNDVPCIDLTYWLDTTFNIVK